MIIKVGSFMMDLRSHRILRIFACFKTHTSHERPRDDLKLMTRYQLSPPHYQRDLV